MPPLPLGAVCMYWAFLFPGVLPKKQETLVTVETMTREHGEELMLQPMGEPCGLNRRIREPTVNRPGLALVGYKKYFASKRVQVFGSVETT